MYYYSMPDYLQLITLFFLHFGCTFLIALIIVEWCRFSVQNSNNQPLTTTESSTSLNGIQAPKQELGPNQAARSMYPSIARSLQKYLRLTKQTGRHNLQSIYEHLSKCILYKLSPRAFLEKFLNQDPVWQQTETNLFASCRLEDSILMNPGQVGSSDLEINSWSLICDTLLSRQVDLGKLSDTYITS